MYYVYIIQSIQYPNQRYIGRTENLKNRLSEHNRGASLHTSKYVPWEFVTFIGFKKEFTAIRFELYLKTGNGRIFAAKRLLALD